MKKRTLKRLNDLADNNVRLTEMRLKLRRLEKEANDLERQIEGLMTEQDRIVFEAQGKIQCIN